MRELKVNINVIARRFLPKQSNLIRLLRRSAPRIDNGLSLQIPVLFICCLGMIGLVGCKKKHPSLTDHNLVVTYAELSILNETEKMTNKITDSLYQIKVKEFFEKKGVTEDAFKEEITVVEKDNVEWKEFVQQVSTAVDSLKSHKIKQDAIASDSLKALKIKQDSLRVDSLKAIKKIN